MWRKQVLVGVQLMLLALVVFSGFKIFKYTQDLNSTDMIQAESQALLKTATTNDGTLSTEQKKAEAIAFVEQLKNDFPDAVGYIRIADTVVDYPVVQAGDNDYYLTHAPDDTENGNGSLFLDYRNDRSFNNDNSIIYGHHLKNGDLFAALDQFRDQAFYGTCSTIDLYTSDGLKTYKVFAVSDVGPDFDYRQPVFKTPADKKAFIESSIASSIIKTYVPTELLTHKDSKFLTLSTCSNDGTMRLVVQAMELQKLVPEKSSKTQQKVQ